MKNCQLVACTGLSSDDLLETYHLAAYEAEKMLAAVVNATRLIYDNSDYCRGNGSIYERRALGGRNGTAYSKQSVNIC